MNTKYLTFIIILMGTALSCKDGEKIYSSSKNDNDVNISPDKVEDISGLWGTYTCTELLNLIKNNADLIESLSSSQLDSDALDYVALYEYQASNYMVVQFTSSAKQYIYCGVKLYDWDKFKENADNSYGSGFHKYLKKYHCGCLH